MLRHTAPLLGSAALLVLAAQGFTAQEDEIDGVESIAAQDPGSGIRDAPSASIDGTRVRTTVRTHRSTFLGMGGGSTGNHGLRVRSAVHVAAKPSRA